MFIINGLQICIYAFDRGSPHIHVKHGGEKFSINIGDRIVEGRAKSNHIKFINEFIDSHEPPPSNSRGKAQRGERLTPNGKMI